MFAQDFILKKNFMKFREWFENKLTVGSYPYMNNQFFKAGDYEFNQAVSMREVWNAITLGKTAVYKITFPEGLTSQQIVERLNNEVLLSGDIGKVPEDTEAVLSLLVTFWSGFCSSSGSSTSSVLNSNSIC